MVRISIDHNVGVMGSEDHLPAAFQASQCGQQDIEQIGFVQLILRLVYDKRTRIVAFQDEREEYANLGSTRQAVQLSVVIST